MVSLLPTTRVRSGIITSAIYCPPIQKLRFQSWQDVLLGLSYLDQTAGIKGWHPSDKEIKGVLCLFEDDSQGKEKTPGSRRRKNTLHQKVWTVLLSLSLFLSIYKSHVPSLAGAPFNFGRSRCIASAWIPWIHFEDNTGYESYSTVAMFVE